MQYRTLGRTDIEVSVIAMGCWGIAGGFNWGHQEESASIAAIEAAVAAGINFFDTAECYAVSEELIGRYVAHRRSQFILATKARPCGWRLLRPAVGCSDCLGLHRTEPCPHEDRLRLISCSFTPTMPHIHPRTRWSRRSWTPKSLERPGSWATARRTSTPSGRSRRASSTRWGAGTDHGGFVGPSLRPPRSDGSRHPRPHGRCVPQRSGSLGRG